MAVTGLGVTDRLDLRLLDAGVSALRLARSDSGSNDIVIVGIDDQTVTALPEPTALWHHHIAAFLDATVNAGARAVCLDLILPDRSYSALGAGYDETLTRAILSARKKAVVVAAATVDAAGVPRGVHAPLRIALGEEGMGYALWPIDADGVVRQLRDAVGDGSAKFRTLNGQLAHRLGAIPRAGLIDYTRGATYQYISLANVLKEHADRDSARLNELFANKIVLLGAILPFEDRHAVPVPLAAWEPESRRVPAVLILAQSLRTDIGRTTIYPVPHYLQILLGGIAGLLWLAGGRARTALLAGATALVLGFGAGFALLAHGIYLAVMGPLLAAFLALASRFTFSAVTSMAERRLLRDAFSRYASEQVLQELMTVGFKAAGEMRLVCALFADIRDYTTRSERAEPARVMSTLNRFFESVIPSIHEHCGMVVEFTGDGLYALFGAPKAVDNPCPAAFAAAKDFLRRVDQLNLGLVKEGGAPLQCGLGLHCGEAVVGIVGAIARHRYTATGDAVNIAARLEGLTRDLGYPLLVSDAVVARLATEEGLVRLGPQEIKGRAPVEVFGWRPAI
jgi:class 3 adenylate cyclase/CHASE2 domain-containing sensor protein